MTSTLDPNILLDARNGRPTRLSRSPHPYHRWSEQHRAPSNSQEKGYLPSPAPTPSTSDTEDDVAVARSSLSRSSPDESGTEVDEEGINYVKALPAPPTKPRKGLRQLNDLDAEGETTPLFTPSQLHEEGRRLSNSYFDSKSATSPAWEEENKVKRIQAEQKFKRRRRAELVRRASELLSLSSLAYVVYHGQSTPGAGSAWDTELLYYIVAVLTMLLLYPLRLFLRPLISDLSLRLGSIEIPAAFDPAPILYPSFLPILVALSLSNSFPEVVLPNIVLGLSALPAVLFPSSDQSDSYNVLHWLIASIPLWNLKDLRDPLPILRGPGNPTGLDPELLILVFPLHQTLLRPLYYLTTTSLLLSELQLFSVSLINLLLYSNSPQSAILRNLLWIGGLGMFFLCLHVLRWNVALERIPNWRFRRAGRVMVTAKTFLTTLSDGVNNHDGNSDVLLSNGTVEEPLDRAISNSQAEQQKSDRDRPAQATSSARKGVARRVRSISDVTNLNMSSTEVVDDSNDKRALASPKASSTIPIGVARQKRRSSHSTHGFLSMTPKQVFARKWGYALYTYVAAVFLIVIPIRIAIALQALNGHEPFGWALGYLFGELPGFGLVCRAIELDTWIALPQIEHLQHSGALVGWVQRYREVLGLATTRLALFAYWASVIALGLLTVLYGLKSTVEVDTRRKVFHGMMVLMLLPSTYVDPCFLALGLSLVLAVFLLLDLFRAAQLKPLSKPLATFLTPYVDGRDLRGPVVVSHIFLLIGCAIPLWLSLAGIERRSAPESDPWRGWELQTRDASMVAGVVCVGMGDAAASLVGRRFGRHKWPWAGGKSLEGSAAFAVAVTVGLLAGRIWLRVGGWSNTYTDDDAWMTTAGKALIAASGASFTEAVLTGANDNVVVPVVLWLLVRGLSV